MNAVRKNNRRTRSKLSLAVEPLESRKLLSGLALDPHFGTGGKVVTDFNGEPNSAFSLALTGGKMLVAGSATFGGDSDFALVRYNADGSLDTTFGAGGLIHTDFGSTNDEAYAMALQADGKIVVVGHTRTDNGAFAESSTLAIQPNGKILVGGYALDFGTGMSDAAIARYNANGSLDSSFGVSGMALVDFGRQNDNVKAMTVLADGRIVLAGYG